LRGDLIASGYYIPEDYRFPGIRNGQPIIGAVDANFYEITFDPLNLEFHAKKK
jgi:hypothetical protein